MNNTKALTNCKLIDVEGKGEVRAGTTIVIEDLPGKGGVIQSVFASGAQALPRGCAVLDMGGAYVLPGLINAHVHLFGSGKPMKAISGGAAQKRLLKFMGTGLGRKILYSMVCDHATAALHSGVTTIRGVGDLLYSDVKLRDAIDSGSRVGPRLLVSGPALCVTGGHGSGGFSLECDSPWEARKQVRKNIHEGVDLIKLCVTGGVTDGRRIGEAGRLQMTEEEVSAACGEAHKAGLLVAAHVESTEGIRVALRGGVDTIEHGAALDDELIELFRKNPKSLRGYSSLVVTLHPALPLYYLSPSVTKLSAVAQENDRIILEGMIKGAKQALKAGLAMGLGTDASCPFVAPYNTWRELVYEVDRLGISPAEALRVATMGNARLLGIEGEVGSVAAGKSADLIVMDENPLEDLRRLERIGGVFIRGRHIDKPAIKKNRAIDEALDSLSNGEKGAKA